MQAINERIRPTLQPQAFGFGERAELVSGNSIWWSMFIPVRTGVAS